MESLLSPKMERLLSPKRQAAEALGISVRTLETLIALGELKSVRVGRRRLIPRTELERFARRDHPTRTAKVSEVSHG
jgi:excisionase family DNA binding protein